MQLRWSPKAADDLASIVLYIRQNNPVAAQRVAGEIYDRITRLAAFPNLGRTGRVSGTREFPLTPLPFIVIYRVLQDTVEIVAILHGAQRWP